MTETVHSILSDSVRQEIDGYLKKFPSDQRRSATLYALRMFQEEQGWVSQDGMDAIAEYLEISPVAVYEVATFYTMYDLKPRAKKKIGICTNVSCQLRGSDELVSHIKANYGVGLNEVTADGEYFFQEVECLGSCCSAPVAIVADKHYKENLTPEKLDKILKEAE
jgi:NADH-quinone oxidoreductase subunit E